MALTLHTPQRPIAPTRKAHQTRIEHDCIGSAEIPAEAYWGIHTLRAIDNFPVSGITVSDHPELIRAYAQVKQACARANGELSNINAYRQHSSTEPAKTWPPASLTTNSPSTCCKAVPAPPPT